ncbi:Gfo/Idh/MocA family protein [Flagellimonas sp. S3867]|uniref:Gfo/Idh/MocA family protein n=1 Tax=Flagellimonas sp. S3867 TaxID=2768063 RepID=UPI001684F926|nr:Gfo/Idh/MocA family oxidoreductase [Flagellimonas sp. S3867]
MKSKIKWGIIGPGNIARKFTSDLKLVDTASVSAVASRNLERAQSFADEFQIPQVFDSYDSLFASNAVDIVYIATPHNFHKDLAIKAMEKGKHILCEKPLGINRVEVEEIIAAAKQNKVFMMEGLWSRFNPSIKKAKQLVDSGEIGNVSYVYADFAFYGLDRDEDSRVLNLDLASGSLLDIGIYPIFLAYLILGMPEEIQASSNFHPNGTEIQTSMIFQYPNAQAVLYSGLTSDSKMEAKISGSQGEIIIPPRWHEADGYSLVKQKESQKNDLPRTGIGFVHEILEVHDCLINNRLESPLWTHQNSLDLVDLMDTVRRKTGIKFPFET